MIPWIKLLTTGANVAEIAREIYVTVKRNKKEITGTNDPSISDLYIKIQLLEDNELKQASLITQMAEQQRILTNRLLVLYIISISSLVTAIFSITIHFWT
ncbi:hypothetical protein BH23BAC1_BH23BAC1_40490 [soil metagenome]